MLKLAKSKETNDKKYFPVVELTISFARLPSIAEAEAREVVESSGSKIEAIIKNYEKYPSMDEMIVDIFDVLDDYNLRGVALNMKRSLVDDASNHKE